MADSSWLGPRYTKTTQVIPTSYLFRFILLYTTLRSYCEQHGEKREMWGWGYLCSLCMPCPACTLPFLYLVPVVFGTAILTCVYRVIHVVHVYICMSSYVVCHAFVSVCTCTFNVSSLSDVHGVQVFACSYCTVKD